MLYINRDKSKHFGKAEKGVVEDYFSWNDYGDRYSQYSQNLEENYVRYFK